MSTVPPNPNHPQQVVVTQPSAAGASTQPIVINTQNSEPQSSIPPSRSSELRLISHSNLFYWWPVWAMAFLMAAITYAEGTHLAFVRAGYQLKQPDPDTAEYEIVATEKTRSTFQAIKDKINQQRPDAADLTKVDPKAPLDTPRISKAAWPGVVFALTLVLTIVVTNVPLRGLWSFVVIIVVIALTLLLALLDVWDNIFRALGNLHIHINYGGYLTIGVLVLLLWAAATFFFDRRTYVLFTPGQLRIVEHIGDAEQTYPTTGVNLEKQRDDIFRHYIFGLGSGDLILKLGGVERREIRLPNVLFLGSQLRRVQELLRTVATT